MKRLWFTLFSPFVLCAGNLSLGPYNKAEFQTQHERTLQKEAKEKEAALKNKKALERYEKRMQYLREKAEKEEIARQEEAQKIQKAKEAKAQAREQRIAQERRNAQAREAIQKNLEQAKLEAQQKQELVKHQEKKILKQHEAITKALENDSDFDLTPEQADMSINNPDDIATELSNINRLRYILLYSDKTPEAMKEYIRFLDGLERDYNLDFAFSYRTVAQAELNEDIASAGGKYDLTARYRPQEGTDIALRVEGRHQMGAYSSTEFKQEIGSLSNTSASYRDEDLYLAQFWIEQDINNFVIRAGKIDPSSYIDSHQFKSASRFFFNATFSSSPYNSFPPLGLGIAAKYVKENYYLSSEITDANAVSGGSNNNVFKEHRFYSAIEAGLSPNDGSKYHITAWHRDQSNTKVESKGLILSAAHALTPNTHLIFRGAASDYATAKRYASMGVGRYSLFVEHDISGLAIGTLVPSNENEKTQTTLESFYRVDPLPGVQISADLQFIYHPSRSEENWALLPGFRLRVLF